MIIGLAILVVWVAIAVINFEIWIRFCGRDTEVRFGYGEFSVHNFGVPETHFDYKVSVDLYPVDGRPTLMEAVFGILPYPTLSINEHSITHSFGVPVWNFALVWAVFLVYSAFQKPDLTKRQS